MTGERRPHDATQTVALGEPLPPRPTAVLSPGSTVADRYEVRDVLGSGGFAVVYLAIDRESGGEVALKVLRPERVSDASLHRLRREAEIANRTASPHLVRVRDVGLDGDTPYLALERVHGESLAQRLARTPDGAPLPLDETLRLSRGILVGLTTLHEAGVLHRDVKPGNVLLSADGRVMLADFGLSLSEQHAAETRATAAEAVIGTVEYLSPEQALAEEVDPRSDLYSFGVVLFEMLTGRLPHTARSSLGMLVAHIQQPAPDVRRLRPDTPRWLAAVVARLLAKKPAERYPSAAAVATDLERRRATGRPGGFRRRLRELVGGWAGRALIAGLLLAAALLWPLAAGPGEPVFSHVRQSGSALHGISETGRLIWTLEDTRGSLQPARLKPGEPLRLVGFPVPARSGAVAQPIPLSILDTSNGEVVRRVEMPTAAQHFSGMSDVYTVGVEVIDLDGDGLDEVIAEHRHSPYWPSYTVLYEPRIERTRLLMVASGHHRVKGSGDFDGDGHRDLLFTGIANRMGFYKAAAAVALDPPVNARPGESGRGATTPDHLAHRSNSRRLLWYSLLPRTVWQGGASVDEEAQRITLRSTVGADLHLDFAGFPIGVPHSAGGETRNADRRDAFWRLREARRLMDVGHVDAGVAEARAARRLAERAGDPVLGEWCRRTEMAILARHGRGEAAETLARELAAGSEHAPEISFDAALAFHLGGDAERAAAWYRRGLGPGASEEMGRGRYEYLHGLVFALLELGRGGEALEEALRYRGVVRGDGDTGIEAYVRWRGGDGAPVAVPDGLPRCGAGTAGRVDFDAWMACELAATSQADPAALLPAVETELGRSSETVAALLSLRARLLHRLGHDDEAAETVRLAWRETRRRRGENLYVRALAPVVAERHAEITGPADGTAVGTAVDTAGDTVPGMGG